MGRRAFNDEHPRSHDGKFSEKGYDEPDLGTQALNAEPEQAVKTLSELEDNDYRRVSANKKQYVKAQDRAAVEAYSEYLAMLRYPSLAAADREQLRQAAENVRQTISFGGGLDGDEILNEVDRAEVIGSLAVSAVRARDEQTSAEDEFGAQKVWWIAAGQVRGFTEALADSVAAGGSEASRFAARELFRELLEDEETTTETLRTEARSMRERCRGGAR